MSMKNVYEVFDDFKAAKNKEERLAVLKKNDTYALRNVLIGAFHPQVHFTVTKIPEFIRENMPEGMAYSNMTTELKRVYLFMEGNPRVPEGLSEKRKEEILVQILESLEPREADVFAGMLLKKLNVPYLTPILVNEAFEGLLP